MAEINQNKINTSNLRNTYMYGKVADRIDFYKYYRNDENSIDDPIFTGFTFDIDTLHSPLFYTGSGDIYSSNTSLRSVYEYNDYDELVRKIENRLDYMYKTMVKGSPNEYEILTLSTKDIIDHMETHRAGYGLQEHIYMDGILYGAADYIYMVDKKTKGKYASSEGSSNIGNGTPGGKLDVDYSKYENNDEAYIEDESVKPTVETVKNSLVFTYENIPFDLPNEENDFTHSFDERMKASAAINPDFQNIIDEHNRNKNNYDDAKQKYDNERMIKHQPFNMSYDEMVQELKNLKNSIDEQLLEAKHQLSSLQTLADMELNNLINNPTSQIATNLDNIKSDYEYWYTNVLSGGYSLDFSNIVAEVYRPTDFENDLKNLDDTAKKYDEKYKIAWMVINTRIKGLNPTEEAKMRISDLQEKINEIGKLLFGENGSKENPDKDSLLGKVNDCFNKLNNDAYSQLKEQSDIVNEDERNKSNTNSDGEDGLNDNTSSVDNTPLGNGDINTDDNREQGRNTRQTYEAPQSVYDILGFIYGMEKLTHGYPYIMNTITGLDEAYRNYFVIKDPYMGSGDNKITINCYESLDLRVSSMFNKYLNAVYDRQYRRERVPVNLRRFNCSVFVHDIRNFRHAMDKYFAEKKDGDDVKSKIVEIALNSVSAIEFKFYDCEIIPDETGGIFDMVSNEDAGSMRTTSFAFTYGNCVINFLPFEDLKKYSGLTGSTKNPGDMEMIDVVEEDRSDEHRSKVNADRLVQFQENFANIDDGNFRRWFDKSELGNVNNNDYRDYIRHDSAVAVDDFYKTSIVNNFALNSISNKNRELTELDDALRRIVVGISASTGIPVKGVTDALNVGFIDPIINKRDEEVPVVKNLGNVYNSKIVNTKTTEYIGRTDGWEEPEPKDVDNLGHMEGWDEPESSLVTELGKMDGYHDYDSTDVTDLGKMDGYHDYDSTDVTDLGKMDGYHDYDSTDVTDLGKMDGYHDYDSTDVNDLGKMDGYHDYDSTDVTDLGKMDGYHDYDSTDVNDLGKINNNNSKSSDVTNLGNINSDNSKSSDVNDLGKIDNKNPNSRDVNDLGNVYK